MKSTSLFQSPCFWLFYRPPAVVSQSTVEVCDSIENMMLSHEYVMACGHFNIDMLVLSKCHSKTLYNFITSHSLIQPISCPTYYSCSSASESILDLLVAPPDVPFANSSLLGTAFSDHLPIVLCINSSLPRPQPTLITHHYNYEKAFTVDQQDTKERDIDTISRDRLFRFYCRNS